MDKYYGLLELADKYKVFKKVSTRYELPDGSKEFGNILKKSFKDAKLKITTGSYILPPGNWIEKVIRMEKIRESKI